MNVPAICTLYMSLPFTYLICNESMFRKQSITTTTVNWPLKTMQNRTFEKQQRNVISVDALRELEFTLLTN